MPTVQDLGAFSRLLVFGGPYSNLHALEALLDRAAKLGFSPAEMLGTGDVCAYCAHPEETTRRVMALGCPVIAGNCEESLGEGRDDCGCGFAEGAACDRLSGQWFAHAAAQLSETSRAWMRARPKRAVLTCAGRRYAVIHGGAEQVNRFIWPTDAPDVKIREIAMLETAFGPLDGVICGHSGVPFIEELDGKYWLNAGSIGLPSHNGDPRTWFMSIDADGPRLHRLSYDHQAASDAMRAAGLTAGYDQTLLTGWWPSEDTLPPELRRLPA